MSWLKRDAPWNIAAMFDTDATFQLAMFWLKAELTVAFMFVPTTC